MAMVKNINIVNSQISNCDNFTKCSTDMITNETEDCDEFRVWFHRHDPQTLKNNTRSNRAKVLSDVHYKVPYTTRISHLSIISPIIHRQL